jgi:anti-sigma regulatory factor (Ser/Thr protein kinase)
MEKTERLAKMRFPARTGQLKEVRCVVRNAVKRIGCLPELTDRIVLAVNEACMNIIQHAYGDKRTGEIILEILLNPVEEELVFRLTDFAEPVDTCVIKSRDLNDLRPGGLGVYLIHEVMDKVEFLKPPGGVGNLLEMRKKIHQKAAK